MSVRTTGAATPIPAALFRAAADDIAGLAGLFAHEALHTAWRRVAGEAIGDKRPPRLAWVSGGADETAGPRVAPQAVLRRFEFSGAALQAIEVGAPSGATPATRHFVHYVFGHLIEGLLIHDVPTSLDHLIENFCNKDNPDYEAAYPNDCLPYP